MRKQFVGAAAASLAAAVLVAGTTPADAATSAGSTAASARGSVAVTSAYNGRISRSEIISRAKYWYAHRGGIPYNWNRTYRDPDGKHRYRTDCSGYVSMALHLSPSGLSAPSTVSLVKYGVKESRTSMKMGDFTGILGSGTGGAAGHVRIFEKWANKAAGTYWAYDFGSTPVKHQIYRLSTDKPRGGHGWTAYRYKKAY